MSTEILQQTLSQFQQVQKPAQKTVACSLSLAEIKKQFLKKVDELAYTRHRWQVWPDWTESAALSIANSVYHRDDIEKRYMSIVDRYSSEEMTQMAHLLGLTTAALDYELQDFLGAMFMELELGNKWRGQFFTPYNLCKVIAELTYSPEQYREGIVTLDEPAVGAGAMVIAKCEVLKEKGVNFQHKLRVVAQDVDWMTFCMAYIQLSLIGCQAQVVHGNSLSLEAKDVWCTPMAMIHGWFG